MAEQCGAGGGQDTSAPGVGTDRFVVTVSVDRRFRRELVASAQAAQTRATELGMRWPSAQVVWTPRPDPPGLVYFTGRYIAGIAGIRNVDRIVHVFALAPGVQIGTDTALTALCREPILSSLLEIVSTNSGYPCWRCRLKVPDPDTSMAPLPTGFARPMGTSWPEHYPRRPTRIDIGRLGQQRPQHAERDTSHEY
jgi:hypothetical protein